MSRLLSDSNHMLALGRVAEPRFTFDLGPVLFKPAQVSRRASIVPRAILVQPNASTALLPLDLSHLANWL